MRVQAYTATSATLLVTIASPRGATASVFFKAAKVHEDFAAAVRALLREYKHIAPTCDSFPVAARIQSYFPVFNGRPLFAVRQLMPAGAPRDIDQDFNLEVMRIRYQLELNILPPAWQASEPIGDAIERHVESAVRELFKANGVPDVYLPGEEGLRIEDRTEIDIICETGLATGRGPVEIPAQTPAP